ncbi:SGNH/GDSL hydrolase family protein [Acidobacteria bacterium AB60]|nr:SGNH/GDSL hydrolase family protein [Acidobacteria bacterium AB60]
MLRKLSAAFVLLLASVAASSQAPAFSSLVVFGDSYCDVGNFHSPGYPYYPDRWSNGPLWVEHIAGFLGVPLLPSSAGGTDYAWDGAAVTNSNYIYSVPQQLEKYLADHGGKADPQALFVLEGGVNDIVGTIGRSTIDDPEKLGLQIARGLVNSETLLRAAGARHFLIANLIDVGRLPAAAPIAALASATTAAANHHLTRLLAEDDTREGAETLRLNLFRLIQAIAGDPTHFGFTNISDACKTQTSFCADPDHYLFFDSLHLSEFAHADIAVAAEVLLAPDDREANDR